MKSSYILVIDDEPDIRNLVREILEDEGYEVSSADGGAQANEARRQRRPDLILLDIWMPDIDGITLLKEWVDEGGLPCPIIMISGHGTVETAVEATRLGAYDFLEKPLSLAKLLVTVQRALEANRLNQENIGLRSQLPAVTDPVGKSAAMQQLRDQVRRLAEHDTSILITGEPGSGRETFARYLHSSSARQNGPFIDVGVASITRQNSAVEIFGSETGSQIHYGRLEQAHGGTLFLDEVGDMDMEAQGQLISALESGTFLRVGGNQSVDVNVRVMAATRYDLAARVSEGTFRDDLFYRLNVVPLHIPPLREHCEDVPELLRFYIDQYVAGDRLQYREFSVAAQNHLRNYQWPGNIPELKNLVQRLLILGGDRDIDIDEVRSSLGPSVLPTGAATAFPDVLDLPLREAREQFEKQYLEKKLEDAGGNVGQLAKAVGMERTHVYRKLKSLGIEIKDKR